MREEYIERMAERLHERNGKIGLEAYREQLRQDFPGGDDYVPLTGLPDDPYAGEQVFPVSHVKALNTFVLHGRGSLADNPMASITRTVAGMARRVEMFPLLAELEKASRDHPELGVSVHPAASQHLRGTTIPFATVGERIDSPSGAAAFDSWGSTGIGEGVQRSALVSLKRP
jgi:hypothetical protein